MSLEPGQRVWLRYQNPARIVPATIIRKALGRLEYRATVAPGYRHQVPTSHFSGDAYVTRSSETVLHARIVAGNPGTGRPLIPPEELFT